MAIVFHQKKKIKIRKKRNLTVYRIFPGKQFSTFFLCVKIMIPWIFFQPLQISAGGVLVPTEQVCSDDGSVHAAAAVHWTLQLQELSVLPAERAEVLRLQQMTRGPCRLPLETAASNRRVFCVLGFALGPGLCSSEHRLFLHSLSHSLAFSSASDRGLQSCSSFDWHSC